MSLQLASVPRMLGTRDIAGLSSDAWEVIGVLVTAGGFLLAGIAALIAAGQLKLAKDVRLEQNRPYIMATLDPSPQIFSSIDVLVRNVGVGPAFDVRIEVDPPLVRARETEGYEIAKTRFFNEPVPMMPPGYELRTWFDDATERDGKDLPERFTFRVTYRDDHGHSWDETVVQDLGMMNDLMFSEILGVHHVAKALRDLHSTLKKAPIINKEPLPVMTETRGEYREREKAAYDAHQERLRKMREAQAPQDQASGDTPLTDPA